MKFGTVIVQIFLFIALGK